MYILLIAWFYSLTKGYHFLKKLRGSVNNDFIGNNFINIKIIVAKHHKI